MPNSPYYSAPEKITIVNEESAMPSKTKYDAYCNSHAEKSSRAALKSAFERAVCRDKGDNLVIFDSLNYIKGYRYELHCIARAHRQQYCVVWLLNGDNVRYKCDDDNNNCSLSEEAMDAFVMRYEAPDGRNRWDKPLFKLDLSLYNKNENNNTSNILNDADDTAQDHSHQEQQIQIQEQEKNVASSEKKALQKSVYNMHNLSAAIDEQKQNQNQNPTNQTAKNTNTSASEFLLTTAIDDILHTLTHNSKRLLPNTSTNSVVAAKGNVLHDVDRITQKVVTAILQTQKMLHGNCNRVVMCEGACTLELIQEVSLAELRRLRRQFIKWVKLHSVEDGSEEGIVRAFFGYIKVQL